jgi:NAD(P)-dependent dehydrogenase (short-subunit alcohol dehydrogenase family)
MASVFVTGSSDGIGQETARQLVRGGHRVVLPARDDARAKEAAAAVPEAAGVAVGDLSVIAGIRQTAASAEPAAAVTGRYLKSRREQRANPAAYDTGLRTLC